MSARYCSRLSLRYPGMIRDARSRITTGVVGSSTEGGARNSRLCATASCGSSTSERRMPSGLRMRPALTYRARTAAGAVLPAYGRAPCHRAGNEGGVAPGEVLGRSLLAGALIELL